jgi:hypothetical protein
LRLHVRETALDEASAGAQFLKRAGWDHYRVLASTDNEAYAMQVFAERLRQALVDSGYAPR